MKKVFTLLLAFIFVGLMVACAPEEQKSEIEDNSPVSVTLNLEGEILLVGTHELTATVLPTNADQSVIYTLVGNYEDVKLEVDKLIVSDTVANGLEVIVKVASKINPLVNSQKKYTISNPTPPAIEISNEEQLRNISLRGNYILINDIELSSNWIPLGIPENEETGEKGEGFSGVLDGNGYKITNLNTAEGGYNKGFFNLITAEGVVKNIGFESGFDKTNGIKAQAWSAVVAGSNHGKISNVYTNVRMEVVGIPGASLVGSNYGVIEYSYTIGEVFTGGGTHGSGLVNSGSEGTIISSYVLNTTVSGAFGYNKQQDLNIQKSETWMKTKQNYLDEGWNEEIWYLVDGNYPLLRNSDFIEPTPEVFVLITNGEEFLDYTDEMQRLLQITYLISNANNEEVLFELLEPVDGVTINSNGLISLTADVLDNTKITVIVTSVEDNMVFDSITIVINNPDGESFIEINSIEDLVTLANSNNTTDLKKNYRLMNNIDLGAGWWNKPIGKNQNSTFEGIFDGNGYSLLNFAGGDAANDYGIFYHIGQYGIVRNLNVEIRTHRFYVGSSSAVLAHKNDGLIENVMIQGEIMSTNATVAGIIYNNTGIIRNVISLVTLLPNESSSVKGVTSGIAHINSGSIIHAYVDKDITSIEHITSIVNEELDKYIVTTDYIKNSLTSEVFNEEIWLLEAGNYPKLKPGSNMPEESTIYITSEEQLRDLVNDPTERKMGLTYILMNDIYLSEEVEGSEMYWTKSIGTDTLRFNGVFDGNGFTIFNVKNEYNTNANFGFFGYIGEQGIVQNLILDTNGVLHVGTNSAVFVQYNYGIIQNVMTFGEIENTTNTRYISGFVRYNHGLIKNAIASVIISHDSDANVRGAFAVSTSGTGTFENALYNHEVAGSSTMSGLSTGPVKFFPSGSNNSHLVDYSTTYYETAENFTDWDSGVWLIVEGQHITLQHNITK